MRMTIQLGVAVCASVAIACSGSRDDTARDTTPTPPMEPSAATEPEPGAETPASPVPIEPEVEPEPAEQAAEEEVAAAQPEQPQRTVARTELAAVRGGDAVGEVTFTEQDGVVTIVGTFSDLPPGKHAIHIHTEGDCGGPGAKRSGEDFNPTEAKHGPPESSERHAGDFGNIVVADDGTARFEMSTDSITVAEGAASIAGRSVVIARRADDGSKKPHGNAGPAIACGVIRVEQPQASAETHAKDR